MSAYQYEYRIEDGPALDRCTDSFKYLVLGGDERVKVVFTLVDVGEDEVAKHASSLVRLTAEVSGLAIVDKTGLLALELCTPMGIVEAMTYNPKNRSGSLRITIHI